MSDWLFAYGSLLPGRENEHILAPLKGRWEPGHVFGVLHPAGIGAALGWPVLILDASGERINGQLFQAPRLAQNWALVDEFEGPAYRRVLTVVTRPAGSTCEAWTYVYNG